MPTIYLHIGPPKTGTTSIQNFLRDNRELLLKHGICYPDLGYRYDYADALRNGHFLSRQKPDKKTGTSMYLEGLGKLQELGQKYDRIILTDEGLWKDGVTLDGFWPRLAEDLKSRNLDIRIITYLRRQDLWVQSFWAQKVKVGRSTEPFPDFLEVLRKQNYPTDYCAYMDMLAGIFGKDALIVRVLEKKQFQGAEQTLNSDFLSIFGLSPTADGFVEKRSVYNTKFSGTYLEFKRILNTLPWFRENKRNLFITAIRDMQALNPFHYDFGRYSFFGPGEQKKYRDSFAQSNSRLAREYLGREDGVLFLDEENDLPPMTVNDADLLRDTIVLCGDLIQRVNGKCKDQQQEIGALRKDVDELRETVKLLAKENTELKKKLSSSTPPKSRMSSLKGTVKKVLKK